MKLKYIRQTIALVLLLVILPAGSWYYLKSGFTFRKAALSELKEYGNLNQVELKNDSGNAEIIDSTHVYLLKLKNEKIFNDYFQKILNAYESRTDVVSFQILCDQEMSIDSSKIKGLRYLVPSTELCAKIVQAIAVIKKERNIVPDVLLVNSKGNIVQGYNLEESNDRARLIKHVSITMPGVKKVEKVVLKSDKEK